MGKEVADSLLMMVAFITFYQIPLDLGATAQFLQNGRADILCVMECFHPYPILGICMTASEGASLF